MASFVNIFMHVHAFYAIFHVSLVVVDIRDIFSAVVKQLVPNLLGVLDA